MESQQSLFALRATKRLSLAWLGSSQTLLDFPGNAENPKMNNLNDFLDTAALGDTVRTVRVRKLINCVMSSSTV
jgi:hypothetical protein